MKDWKKEKKTNFLSIHDLTSVSPLNEETVLHSLEDRYEAGIYYTWAGTPLIALNPYHDVTGLYDEVTANKYRKELNTCVADEPTPAHIYAVGQRACRDLRRDMNVRNQSIIVSGESGAGKTWTTRSLMQFIADMTEKSNPDLEQQVVRVEQRILDSNPILEAFGNASTVRNENSSRFGKYIQLEFDRTHQITGATIKTYLLEKTRVVHQAKGEKNFHIFYQMSSCYGSDESPLTWDDGAFLFGGGSCETPSAEDARAKNFQETREAMRNIGIHDILQCEIFKVLTAIKNLANVRAVPDQERPNEPCVVTGGPSADRVCTLLELDPTGLADYFSFRRIAAGSKSEEFMKPCSAEECVARRDCLAKLIYSRLFDWVVEFINASIRSPDELSSSFIGLLDVYGFESFEDNSLEQLCINYANEKLQQHFVYHFMKKQQEEYEKECVEWSFQSFVDNRPCLDLIEGRIGVFSLMNEECRLSRKLDNKSFCDRLDSCLRQNAHYSRPLVRRSRDGFAIHHYADSVCYNVNGLIEKNKDYVPPEVVELLHSSSNWFLQKLFKDTDQVDIEQKGKSSTQRPAAVTVVSKFKASLDSLMATLRSTNAHYIRCIKPNSVCKAAFFDRLQVLNQLKACGVVETIRISAAGYPVRFSLIEFHKRYSFVLKYLKSHQVNVFQSMPPLQLDSPSFESPQSPARRRRTRGDRRSRLRRRDNTMYDHTRHLCRSILELTCLPLDEDKENVTPQRQEMGVKLGRTKVFIKEKQMEKLESIRTKCLSKCSFTIQCCWSRYKHRLQKRRTNAAVNIQKGIRCWLVRRQYLKKREAVVTLQRHLRRYLTRKTDQQDSSLLHLDIMSTTMEMEDSALSISDLSDDSKCTLSQPFSRMLSRRVQKSRMYSINDCLFPSRVPCRHVQRSCYLTLFGVKRNFIARDFWELLIYQVSHAECLRSKQTRRTSLKSERVFSSGKGAVSVREIEQAPFFFHCRTTPLANANTRPAGNTSKQMGFAGIRSLVNM